MRSDEVGRVEGLSSSNVMDVREVAKHLLSTCPSLSRYSSFIFGSSLKGSFCDFDVLTIGPAGESLRDLKAELLVAGMEVPLHILHMLPSEAQETDFVASERCVPLSDLACS